MTSQGTVRISSPLAMVRTGGVLTDMAGIAGIEVTRVRDSERTGTEAWAMSKGSSNGSRHFRRCQGLRQHRHHRLLIFFTIEEIAAAHRPADK
jgi:hypothetical protein